MMRYFATEQFSQIESSIADALAAYGLRARLAKDKAYSDGLWANVQIYMHACRFGIAVFEDMETRAFNPNVALELGYMYALGKRVLLLRERRLPTMPTDVMGQLYRSFDAFDISRSVKRQIDQWVLSDLGLRPIKRRRIKGDKLRILVVEDDPRFVQLISRSVEAAGYETVVAATVSEARRSYMFDRPDIVLLDLQLPLGEDRDMELLSQNSDTGRGRILLRQLKAVANLPVIIISRASGQEDIVAGLDVGADDYIVKPFTAKELLARVNAAARRVLSE